MLLRKPTLERSVVDYELAFDDFIVFAGGNRTTERFAVPEGIENPDYYLDAGDYDLVLELKQISIYRSELTPDAYLGSLFQHGRIKRYEPLGNGQIRIGPESLSRGDWNRFYKSFRPSVGRALDKAASQLKASRQFLPPPRGRRFYGALLVNTGDFNLPTDLLFRLVEYQAKDKWRRGLYSYLDFAMCMSLDLVQEGRNPLHTRQIVRTNKDPELVEAVHQIFDQWVHYGAAAFGATVTFQPTTGPTYDPVHVEAKVRGKLQRVD